MFALLFTILPGLAGKALDYFSRKADRDLQGFTTGAAADTDRLKAWLKANAENNALKAAQSGWWGARVIVLIAGLPAAAHFAAVFLDSTIPPFGSWGIPKAPPPYDGYEWAIVQSFFLVMPAMPLVSAAAMWMRGRR